MGELRRVAAGLALGLALWVVLGAPGWVPAVGSYAPAERRWLAETPEPEAVVEFEVPAAAREGDATRESVRERAMATYEAYRERWNEALPSQWLIDGPRPLSELVTGTCLFRTEALARIAKRITVPVRQGYTDYWVGRARFIAMSIEREGRILTFRGIRGAVHSNDPDYLLSIDHESGGCEIIRVDDHGDVTFFARRPDGRPLPGTEVSMSHDSKGITGPDGRVTLRLRTAGKERSSWVKAYAHMGRGEAWSAKRPPPVTTEHVGTVVTLDLRDVGAPAWERALISLIPSHGPMVCLDVAHHLAICREPQDRSFKLFDNTDYLEDAARYEADPWTPFNDLLLTQDLPNDVRDELQRYKEAYQAQFVSTSDGLDRWYDVRDGAL